MVWGGVSQHHRTELVVIEGNLNAVCYREDILLLHGLLFLQAHPDMTLQHDNATRHTARSMRDFLQDRNVLVEEWGNISQQEQANLVQSMRNRCTAVLNAAGGHTRY
jgi:hypothetical protein